MLMGAASRTVNGLAVGSYLVYVLRVFASYKWVNNGVCVAFVHCRALNAQQGSTMLKHKRTATAGLMADPCFIQGMVTYHCLARKFPDHDE